MVILDTNVVIDHLRLPPETDTIFIKIVQSNKDEMFCISIVTIQELYQGKSSRESKSGQAILAVLDSLRILPYNVEIAKLAGEIIRDLSSPIGFADAAIAATAVLNNAKLLTLNIKDFQGIKGLEMV